MLLKNKIKDQLRAGNRKIKSSLYQFFYKKLTGAGVNTPTASHVHKGKQLRRAGRNISNYARNAK